MVTHSIEHIQERLEFIQRFLEAQYDSDEGNLIHDRLTELGAYMAESGKLKADAEYHYNARMMTDLVKALTGLLPDYSSATLQNAFVKSLAKDERQLVTYADRVNRSCTHQIEVLRTQLSYIKSLPK